MSNVPIKAETNRRSSVESTGAYVVAYIAVLALKWPMIDQQPVWDEAFSVHPAAMTLAHNGFDLWGLLHEPSFAEGGPNVHAGSLVTVLTAVAYRWLEGGPWLFPLLHLGHFAVAAYCLAAAFHFSRALFGPLLAALFTGAVLCYPLFHVQAGFMYLETPLLACTLSALTAWSTQRRKTALACAVLAVLVKVTGILVAGTLAAAWLLESRPGGRRIGWVLAAALVPGFILAALLLIVHTPGGAGYRPPPYGAYLRFYLADRLLQLPDLCFFFLVTLLVGVLRWKTVLRGLTARSPAVGGTGWSPKHAPHSARLCRRPRLGTQDDAPRIVQGHLAGRRLAVAHLLTLVFLAFHLAAPFVFENYLLPRYLVQIVPFMFLALVDALRQATSAVTACLLTATCCVLFLANREGLFYPRGVRNDFSIAERSEAYRDLLAVERAGVRALAATPSDVPVFYGLPEHYFTHYPLMGYVNAVPANGHCLAIEAPYDHARLDDFPEHFFLLYDYAFLGGQQIESLVGQAVADPRRELVVAGQFVEGDYKVVLLEVRPRSSPPSAATKER